MDRLSKSLESVDCRTIERIESFDNWQPVNRTVGIGEIDGRVVAALYTTSAGDNATQKQIVRQLKTCITAAGLPMGSEEITENISFITIEEQSNADTITKTRPRHGGKG